MKDAVKQKCSIEDELFLLQYPHKKLMVEKFRHADDMLSQQYQPQQILNRDKEMNDIQNFINQFISTGYSRQSLCMLSDILDIYGSTGLGKTLCVNRIFDQFMKHQQYIKGKLKLVRLNAMRFKHANDLYKNMYLELSSNKKNKKRISTQNALYVLDGIFNKNQVEQQDLQISAAKKLVLIDQIDYLKTRDEQVLYNIFNWTQSQNSKLAIIGISNTFDFPQRLLPKIRSRMGNRKIIYQPYTVEALTKIINQRVEPTQVFEKSAVNYISKILVKATSDIRKLFSILRQSINIHVQKTKGSSLTSQRNSLVNQRQVAQSYDKNFTPSFAQRYKRMPLKYRIVSRYIAEYFRRNGKQLHFYKAWDRLERSAGYFRKFSRIKNNISQIFRKVKEIQIMGFKITDPIGLDYSCFFKS